MRHTIEVRFEEEYVGAVSSFIAFVRAIKGRGFPKNLIGKWLDKLVDKDDYARKDREQILNWLATK